MPKKSGAQRKQASRAREKEQIGVEAFNEKNNADNRRRQSRIKEEAILAATEESGNGGGLSQMPDAIRRRKDREKRVSRLGKGTVQKESHDEYVDRKSRTVTFSKNVPPDIVNEWEEGALDLIKDHRQDVQDVGAKESDALALGSDVVALGSDSVALLSSMQKESDVVGLLSSMQSNVKGNITNTVVSDSRLSTPRNPSSPVSFTPMASSSSSQPMSPVVRKVKDQESSNRTSVSPLQQDSASQVALKICPLLSEGGVFSLENTSSSILTRIRLHDVNHFTFDNDLPLIGINGEEEMEFDIFGDHPICSPIVRMPLKKRLLARKEHEDVLAGGG